MKKIILLIIALGLFLPGVILGQENGSKNIAIKVEMPKNLPVKNDAGNILFNRLNQAVALNGLGATSGKFLLVPNVTVLSKDVTTSIPQQFIVELEVSMFIVDATQKTILQQESITVKGIAENEGKAILKAISSIQSRNPRIKNLIVRGKEKIANYYNQECDLIIKKVESLINRDLYYDAIVELEAIPQTLENAACYEQALKMLEQIDADVRSKAESQIQTAEYDLDWVK